MSHKRPSTTDLNHDNWDAEEEPEEAGTFKFASQQEMSSRVIKKARRRCAAPTGGDGDSKGGTGTKNIFSGISGFSGAASKPPNSSSLFAFLNQIPAATETASVSSSTSDAAKTSTAPAFSFAKSTGEKGSPSLANTSSAKSAAAMFSFGSATTNNKDENSPNTHTKSANYCSYVKSLNEALMDCLQKAIKEHQYPVFSSILKEYNEHLEKYVESDNAGDSAKSDNKTSTPSGFKIGAPTGDAEAGTKANGFKFGTGLTVVSTSPSETAKPNGGLSFGEKANATPAAPMFSFGSQEKKSPLSGASGFSTNTFKFSSGPANSTATQQPLSSIFSTPTSATDGAAAKPGLGFSFGTGAKPFSFGNIQPPAAAATQDPQEDEDKDEEPPKVEFTQVVENDALYTKRCKVFVKKDNNFVDRGVGTLYLKPVPDSTKAQLIVRADTNLGNILLNFILNKSFPAKLNGKNNVMIVCLPTPEAEKPTPILIRVRTAEDAEELLKEIEKHNE